MGVRVCNYHPDGYDHVNNARYLEFLKEARWMFLEQRDLPSALKDIVLIVTRTDIRCCRPAAEGDRLRFEDRLKKMASCHIVLTQTIILSSGKNAVEAEITMMAVNVANGCSISIPAPPLTALKTIAAE